MERIDRIPPFRVIEVRERAQALEASGRDVIHLEVGEPDFPTPEAVVEAGVRALRDGATRYTAALGIAPLREAIAADYRERLRVAVEPEQIVVTAGASGALLLAMLAVCNPGDELLLPDPGYPSNEVFALASGLEPRALPTQAADGWQPTVAAVRDAWRAATRALLLASPSNPAGATLDATTLRALDTCVREQGGVLLLDEIYQGLPLTDLAYRSGLAIVPDLITINSFSKYFCMTGWRLGWLVVPRVLVEPIERLTQNLFISPSAPAQAAALAAFSPPVLEECEHRLTELVRRQRRLLAGLKQLGFGVPVEPKGGFYLFADLAPLGLELSGMEFCHRLLEEQGVALTPGIDFGQNGTAQMVRFAATSSEARIDEALLRIARWLEQR